MKQKLAVILIFVSGFVSAQEKSTQVVEQLWTGYFNQSRISDRWGFWFDAQFRTRENFFEGAGLTIIRPGITYYVTDAIKLTAGYGYIHQYAQDNFIEPRPEHRPWQQVQWHTRYGRNSTMQYIRLEERFRKKIGADSVMVAGHNFNYRLRYNLLWQLPLSASPGKGSISWIFNDELHINFGKEVVYNYFDQNRFFTGISYQAGATGNFQLGYLNVFQQLPSGSRYRMIHGARIFSFQNLDLRKTKK